MTWTTLIDPPSDGTAITRAFYITYTKDNLSHLRTVTGGDPTVANQVLASTGAGAAAWSTSLTLATLVVGAGGITITGGGLVVGVNAVVGGTLQVNGASTLAAVSATSVASSGAVAGTTISASASGTVGAPAFVFTSTEGGGTDGFYESGSHTPAIAVSGVQIQRWVAGNTIITAATQMVGQVTITGSGTYTGTWAAASDRRLKTAIQPVTNALSSVLALKPITYRPSRLYRQLYGANELEANRYQGLIAQDVQTVFPDIVTVNRDDNNMLAVDYSRLVVPLVAALQELAAKVAALEAVP